MSVATQASVSDDPQAEERMTPLRMAESRARALSFDSQIGECVDLLQAPDVLRADLSASVEEVIQGSGGSPGRVSVDSNPPAEENAFFYPSRELFVQGDGCSFTCLSTDLLFRDDAPLGTGPIDYGAVTCEARPFPVLGFTQKTEEESAYPVLLSALASLIELTLPLRFEALDRDVYRGLLGPAPVFDLALVLWDDESTSDPRRPLCELARDLAELMKAGLRDLPRFPPVLNDIVCLRLNNKRFDGRLRFAWRV